METDNEIDCESNFGRSTSGWWWGVWQGNKLVGFGAGYKRKQRSFRHERECLNEARRRELPEIKCENASVMKREK